MTGKNSRTTAAGMLKRLRNDVLLGKIKPGTFLRQHSVAVKFGVSRTPAREALKALEAEGLVENLKNRGYRVKKMTLTALLEIVDIRALLEGHAARLAALSSNGKLAQKLRVLAGQIEKAEKLYKKTRKGQDLIKWSQKEYEFHQAIIEASGNELLVRLTRGVNFQWISFMRDSIQGKNNKAVPSHFDIAAAIAKSDADEAEQTARRHLSNDKKVGLENFLGPVSNTEY